MRCLRALSMMGITKPQGRAIWLVNGVRKEPSNGIWLTCSLEVVEDEHLHWWLTKGPGKEHTRIFKVHICAAQASKCRQNKDSKTDEFHLDNLRMLEVSDLKYRRCSWWISGVSKADFEKLRRLKLVLEGALRMSKIIREQMSIPCLSVMRKVIYRLWARLLRVPGRIQAGSMKIWHG